MFGSSFMSGSSVASTHCALKPDAWKSWRCPSKYDMLIDSHIICSGVPVKTMTSGWRVHAPSGCTRVARLELGGNVGRSATILAAASASTTLWKST